MKLTPSKSRPYKVFCNNNLFAQFDDEVSARKAMEMWCQPRPTQVYTFRLEGPSGTLSEKQSSKKGGL